MTFIWRVGRYGLLRRIGNPVGPSQGHGGSNPLLSVMDYLLDTILPVVARIALAVLPVLILFVAIAQLPKAFDDDLCLPLVLIWVSCIAYIEVRLIGRGR